MANLGSYFVCNALASKLSASEQTRLALVGSFMSPLTAALIVEALVESEEKDNRDEGEGDQALFAARSEEDKARVESEQKGSGDEVEGDQALSAARSEEDKARVEDEKREVERMEQKLYDRATRAKASGGFTAQQSESANEDLEFLKIQEEKLAADRTKLIEDQVRDAAQPDSEADHSY
jgi:hypothetical protein